MVFLTGSLDIFCLLETFTHGGMGWDGWVGRTWCTRDKAGKILEGLKGSITKKVRFTGASCTDSHFYSTT